MIHIVLHVRSFAFLPVVEYLQVSFCKTSRFNIVFILCQATCRIQNIDTRRAACSAAAHSRATWRGKEGRDADRSSRQKLANLVALWTIIDKCGEISKAGANKQLFILSDDETR